MDRRRVLVCRVSLLAREAKIHKVRFSLHVCHVNAPNVHLLEWCVSTRVCCVYIQIQAEKESASPPFKSICKIHLIQEMKNGCNNGNEIICKWLLPQFPYNLSINNNSYCSIYFWKLNVMLTQNFTRPILVFPGTEPLCPRDLGETGLNTKSAQVHTKAHRKNAQMHMLCYISLGFKLINTIFNSERNHVLFHSFYFL